MRVRKRCNACTGIAWQRARSFADVTNWAKSLWSLCQQPTRFLLSKGDSKSPTCDERQTKNIRETRWIGLNVSDARHVGVKLCSGNTTHTFSFPTRHARQKLLFRDILKSTVHKSASPFIPFFFLSNSALFSTVGESKKVSAYHKKLTYYGIEKKMYRADSFVMVSVEGKNMWPACDFVRLYCANWSLCLRIPFDILVFS